MSTRKKTARRKVRRLARYERELELTRREQEQIRREQADVCPECRTDATVAHLVGCSRGAFPAVGSR